jgi:hypothetical protein
VLSIADPTTRYIDERANLLSLFGDKSSKASRLHGFRFGKERMMQKKVVGVLESFYAAQGAVKDMLGAGFESDRVSLDTNLEKQRPLVEASAENEIMADRAVVILRRYGAAEIDERPEEDPPIRPA